MQIVSQIEGVVKTTKDTAVTPFGTIKVKVLVESQIIISVLMVIQQIQILRPESNKIPAVLQKLSCRVLKIKKGTKIAHVEDSNVVPPLMVPQLNENVPKKVAGNALKNDLLKSLHRGNGGRLEKLFASLNLDGIESWDEQQQQSV